MIAVSLRTNLLALLLCATAFAQSGPQTKTVHYELDGTKFESVIIHQGTPDKPKPGILMVPN
ncbi:MAG: dienelactone hydrolase family protein, partial [Planctomycetes bacterium]|nr:dienelactone hydrolase family protein [Planctomycetota bacterium]